MLMSRLWDFNVRRHCACRGLRQRCNVMETKQDLHTFGGQVDIGRILLKKAREWYYYKPKIAQKRLSCVNSTKDTMRNTIVNGRSYRHTAPLEHNPHNQ